jgi:DNA-binding transcriptional LysR family regulator
VNFEKNILTLTEGGKFILEQAKDILNRSYVAVQTLKTHYTNTDKPLVIGYIPTILQTFLGQILNRFGLAYPEVAVRFQEMARSILPLWAIHPMSYTKSLQSNV